MYIQPWAHPDLDITACCSQAGWYVGQVTDEGEPFSRLSKYYYDTRKQAISAICQNTWIRKENP